MYNTNEELFAQLAGVARSTNSSVSIFVGVPKIAQDKVNDAKLEVQGVNVLNSKPDSILLQINSTITTDGSIKANIDPFDGVMYLEDLPEHTPFLNLSFPATNGDKHQKVNISQESQIQNPDAFNTFNIWFAANQTLRVTIEGRTKVKPSGLSRKWGVTFKKTIVMNGLNLFNGTTVSDGKIDITAKKGEPNFHATADIPNASYFTLDIVSCQSNPSNCVLVLTCSSRATPPSPTSSTTPTLAT